MATRSSAKKKSLLQILALIIAVVIVFASLYLIMQWWNSRPGPDPREVTVTATVGDSRTEIPPYQVCELDQTDCPEGEIPAVPVGADQDLIINIPDEIADLDWQAVMIYDDPAANEQVVHGPKEATSLTVPGSVDPLGEGEERPRLVVVEISTLMISTDDAGEETPVSAIWSIDAEAR